MRSVGTSRVLLAILVTGVLFAALSAPAAAQTGYQFYSLTPCRLADTRGNGFTGAQGPPVLSHGQTRNFPVQGLCGVPVGAKAVTINVTAIRPTGNGFLTAFPAGMTLPVVSTLNFNANEPAIANGAIVPLGTSDGSGTCPAGCDLAIYSKVGGSVTPATVHMVLDVTGYFQ